MMWKVYAARFHGLPWQTIGMQLGIDPWDARMLYGEAVEMAKAQQKQLREADWARRR